MTSVATSCSIYESTSSNTVYRRDSACNGMANCWRNIVRQACSCKVRCLACSLWLVPVLLIHTIHMISRPAMLNHIPGFVGLSCAMLELGGERTLRWLHHCHLENVFLQGIVKDAIELELRACTR